MALLSMQNLTVVYKYGICIMETSQLIIFETGSVQFCKDFVVLVFWCHFNVYFLWFLYSMAANCFY